MEPFLTTAFNTPAYVCDLTALERNLTVFAQLKDAVEVEVLLSLKGFALRAAMPLIGRYLDGTAASSLYEARFGRETADGCVHTYAPAFRPRDMEAIIALSDRITFNSLNQWEQYAPMASGHCSCGLRINTQSVLEQPAYCDPGRPGSRLGIRALDTLPEGIEGLHLHALCAQDSHALAQVLDDLTRRFGHLLPHVSWLNLGGGHALTRGDYDPAHLIALLRAFKDRYPHLRLILEPAQAVVHESGVFVASVLDVIDDVAVLDASTEAHLVDVIITGVPPRIRGADAAGIKPFTYHLGGNSCLAGDLFGTYSFDRPLQISDRIIFEDRMHYSFVKATTFNGIALPDLVVMHGDGRVESVGGWGYERLNNN